MSDEEQPEEAQIQIEEPQIQIEEPPAENHEPTLRDPTLRKATLTDNDEQAYRRPSIPRSNDSYQSARRKTNVNNMNVCQKIIISIVSALFVLILFISTCLAVNGQIKSEMAQFRKEFEAKNKIYNAEVKKKVTHESIVQKLELLKTAMAAKDKKLENEITDIDDLEKARDTKLVDIKKNCMLQDDDGNHNKDQDFCCQLLAQTLTPESNTQQFEHCLSLLLKVRYGISMAGDGSIAVKSTLRCPQGNRIRNTVCCTQKWGRNYCKNFKENILKMICYNCYTVGGCRNRCGPGWIGR